MTVGIRELKNRLSHYLERVKAGEKLAVTDRGAVIAYVLPASAAPNLEGLIKLVREERASWGGGKPSGLETPARVQGKAVSEIVIEERR
jgi:prevent-host-death family protein